MIGSYNTAVSLSQDKKVMFLKTLSPTPARTIKHKFSSVMFKLKIAVINHENRKVQTLKGFLI